MSPIATRTIPDYRQTGAERHSFTKRQTARQPRRCRSSGSYDIANNLTSLKYPDGRLVTYGYDGYNRLQTVTDWSNRVTTYEYDLAGRLTKTTRPNATVRSQIFCYEPN